MRGLLAYLACVVVVLAVACSLPVPHGQETIVEFVQQPTDRPVLQTRAAVWNARMYGSEYPQSYIDYAAWYVRLD